VLVDTQVVQDGNIVDARTLELDTPGKRNAWSVRLPNRVRPALLRYKERLIYKDGGLEQENWRESITSNIVVGIPAEGTLTVTVSYFGPLPSSVGLSAIMLDLQYTDPAGDPKFTQSTSLLITDEASTHTQDWKVRLADRQARTYQWRLTMLHDDGTESSTDFKTDTREKLILRPQL
jgi:hypothetical protein